MLDTTTFQILSRFSNFRIINIWPEFVKTVPKKRLTEGNLLDIVHSFSGVLVAMKNLYLNSNSFSMYSDLVFESFNDNFSPDGTPLISLFIYFTDPKDAPDLITRIEGLGDIQNLNFTVDVAKDHQHSILLAQHLLFSESRLFMNVTSPKQHLHCKQLSQKVLTGLGKSREFHDDYYMMGVDSTLDLYEIKPLKTSNGVIFNTKVNGNDLNFENSPFVDEGDYSKGFQVMGTNTETLLFDPYYHGFCYGLKFVSLKHAAWVKKNSGKMNDFETLWKYISDNEGIF
ncbi:hypothetical protein GEMRC1_010469 [Eukaryota sp. GEM-RC1]